MTLFGCLVERIDRSRACGETGERDVGGFTWDIYKGGWERMRCLSAAGVSCEVVLSRNRVSEEGVSGGMGKDIVMEHQRRIKGLVDGIKVQ